MSTLLELGAGDRPHPGFVHNDARALEHIEIVCDARHIGGYVPPDSCAEVRATHLLEHFSHRETDEVLESWMRLLEPGGKLYLEVPNFEWQARALANAEPDPMGRRYTDDELVVLVFGEQDHDGNYHHTAFTPSSLRARLLAVGFTDVSTHDIGQVICATARRFA